MKIKIKSLFLILVPILLISMYFIKLKNPSSTVRAFAHLNVDFGVPPLAPIFQISNMLPGDCFTRKINVENSSDFSTNIATRSNNETDLQFLSRTLNIKISEDSSLLYNDSLENFFADSTSLDGIPLSLLPAESETEYQIEICFDERSVNSYQNTSVIFDLAFGEVISPITLPKECSHLEGLINFTIEGTEGRDKINGTRENELILGFGGRDKIDGKGGHDCILGGEGDDNLDGGTGNDIILGGTGNDSLEGGTGEDRLFGEEGNDELEGSGSIDFLDGGGGFDILDGGTGRADTCINGEEIDDSCEL